MDWKIEKRNGLRFPPNHETEHTEHTCDHGIDLFGDKAWGKNNLEIRDREPVSDEKWLKRFSYGLSGAL